MDPEATWNLMVEAIIAKDRIEAQHRAADLLHWLEIGGFSPTISFQRLSQEWQRTLCGRLCRNVMTATANLWE